MIRDKCEHYWTDSPDYIPFGGGFVQPMLECGKCHKRSPSNEVTQLKTLTNQDKTLKHIRAQTGIAIAAIIVSFIASLVSLFKK